MFGAESRVTKRQIFGGVTWRKGRNFALTLHPSKKAGNEWKRLVSTSINHQKILHTETNSHLIKLLSILLVASDSYTPNSLFFAHNLTMNNKPTNPKSPLSDPLDLLLADVAIRVQLSRTDYSRAVGRYQAINDWIERDESPLIDRVQLFYPQGSMAIGSTIASKLKTDEFDIDIAAQLDLPEQMSPAEILDLLFEAIRGKPGSRYYSMTKRRTRCITVDYSDNMHLDVTPMLRLEGTPERESLIFHHRAEAPDEPSYQLVANPYGFAEWFISKAPKNLEFMKFFEKRAGEYEQMQILSESDPVPPQEPPLEKSITVIVLQLLKRWRNIQYDLRPGRRPPSIMIAKLVADATNNSDSLSEAMFNQAKYLLSIFCDCQDQGRLIHVENPICNEDILTDRWPSNLRDQGLFVNDLENLVEMMERLISGCNLAEMQKIMTRLFGETPTTDIFKELNKNVGELVLTGNSKHQSGTGRLILPVIGGAAPVIGRASPKHTFYGDDNEKK